MEYTQEWPAVVAMAPEPVPTNMQLSIYQTNGFTGMWTADQVSLLQIHNGMNGYARTVVAQDPDQTTASPCRNRLNEAMDTPVEGKWTAIEDTKLLRAAEKPR
jgi:hypothetical protein